jgi:hypothetical protein
VAKLKAARDRQRALKGRCEGPKPVPVEVVREAKRLARRNPKTGKTRSLRGIAKELAELGYFGPRGKPYGAQSVKNMFG